MNLIRKNYPQQPLAPSQAFKKHQEIIQAKLTPAVFGDWFTKQFPDPTSWYIARLNYVRTCAVMSMIGYVIGLGDRHLENILIDSKSGELVHVDFDCLFNKGETLQVPECVPFRLTHNMVDGMGPTGYEGVFRKTCEATLRVMRDNKDALLSVLRPFVYDPLLTWKNKNLQNNPNLMVRESLRPVNSEHDKETIEITNTEASKVLATIERRLRGFGETSHAASLPLSISGQVNELIDSATDEKKLAKMFVGWAPYL